MEPQVIAAIISGSIGAFAGITRALGNFSKKLDRRFENVERKVLEFFSGDLERVIQERSR